MSNTHSTIGTKTYTHHGCAGSLMVCGSCGNLVGDTKLHDKVDCAPPRATVPSKGLPRADKRDRCEHVDEARGQCVFPQHTGETHGFLIAPVAAAQS